MDILVKPFYPDARLPTKKFSSDAGFDLFTYGSFKVGPNETIGLDCGVRLYIPAGLMGIIVSRSSWRQRGLVCLSIIDSFYTGLIQPHVTNSSTETLEFQDGERVLQLIPVQIASLGCLRLVSEMPESLRGDSDLGSTGRF